MELTECSAVELAGRIARREASAVEVLEAHFRQCDRLNRTINAVITEDRQSAMDQARHVDQALARGESGGPLQGVPMTVKDTFDVRGMRTMIGLPWLKNHVASEDAYLVERLKQAGAIIWGKTNMPFASYDWNSNHPTEGICRNPWDLDRSPGGSSGGAAAALAAGITPIEIGSDVAGSIRYPAHCCGVYGIRPTEGLLPVRGHGNVPGVPYAMGNHVTVGPLARYIEDLVELFPLLVDETSAAGKQAFAASQSKPLGKLRIGWTETWGADQNVPICDATRRALHDFADLARGAGAEVQPVDTPFDVRRVYSCYGVTHGFEYAAMFPPVLRNAAGRWGARTVYFPWKYNRGEFTHFVGQGLTASPTAYFAACEERTIVMDAFDEWFDQWDVWLTPTAATTALPIGRRNRPAQVGPSRVPYCDVAGNFCCPTAALGHPIVTIPVGLSGEGLPIGLQVHGRRFSDLALLNIAQRLTELMPGIRRPPLDEL